MEFRRRENFFEILSRERRDREKERKEKRYRTTLVTSLYVTHCVTDIIHKQQFLDTSVGKLGTFGLAYLVFVALFLGEYTAAFEVI